MVSAQWTSARRTACICEGHLLTYPRPGHCLPHACARSQSQRYSHQLTITGVLQQTHSCMCLVPNVCAQNSHMPLKWHSQLHSWAWLQFFLHTHSLMGMCTPMLTLDWHSCTHRCTLSITHTHMSLSLACMFWDTHTLTHFSEQQTWGCEPTQRLCS